MSESGTTGAPFGAGRAAVLGLVVVVLSVGAQIAYASTTRWDGLLPWGFSTWIFTVSAIAVYLLIVLTTSAVIPSHGTPAIAVAFATLAAATVFLPMLRMTRRTLDRRFNREQYDAEVIVQEFGERIRAGIAHDATAADLAHAVELALQPTSIGIWQRPATR